MNLRPRPLSTWLQAPGTGWPKGASCLATGLVAAAWLSGCQTPRTPPEPASADAARDVPGSQGLANATAQPVRDAAQPAVLPQNSPGASDPGSLAAASPAPPAPFRVLVPGTALALDFAPLTGPTGNTLWLSTTEVPWEAYDVFLFGFDLPAEQRVSGWDATARPSRPYGSPDRGLGHRGFAAQAVTAHAAEGFCTWLSQQCGASLRLPTESEWEWAAREAAARPAGLGDALSPARKIPAELGQQVGFAPYEGPRPVALANLSPNRLGLRGLTGNLAEWVRRDDGSGHVTAGGCFLDAPEECQPERREAQAASWNETDPQNPKSRWWLANAPFVGFRVLAESAPKSGPP